MKQESDLSKDHTRKSVQISNRSAPNDGLSKDKIEYVLERFRRDPVDLFLIEPPFAFMDRPSLALHLLQALALQEGVSAGVLYANLLYASEIGEEAYQKICGLPTGALIGERIFAHCAFDGELRCLPKEAFEHEPHLQMDDVRNFQETSQSWLNELITHLAQLDLRIVGCTSTFEQTTFSLALMRGLKAQRPDILMLMGGANCEGDMGRGLFALRSGVDYLFSGESEGSFPEFLRQYRRSTLPPPGIIPGQPYERLDDLPFLDFKDFFEQITHVMPDSEVVTNNGIRLPMETSRGCWWGQKHHCTFCGLNGEGMQFRTKSSDRVVEELRDIVTKYSANHIFMVDNIMPHQYFKSLLPTLKEEFNGLSIFYEQKANISFGKMSALKAAGVNEIQPGIEALDTALLVRMRKGVTARQNIDTLRFARSLGVGVSWNLLFAFPGDEELEYERTLELIPLLRHLQPPSGCYPLSIDRFSPYFNDHELFGITDIRPIDAYGEVFPENANLAKIAYHFDGDYDSAESRQPDLFSRLEEESKKWQLSWTNVDRQPSLFVERVRQGLFVLVDTRDIRGTKSLQFIDESKAEAVLLRNRVSASDLDWALESKVVANVDEEFIPLATAAPELFRELSSTMN